MGTRNLFLAMGAITPRLVGYSSGGQLVFDWDRLENFLITNDRPVGSKVTSTKCHKMQRF